MRLQGIRPRGTSKWRQAGKFRGHAKRMQGEDLGSLSDWQGER